MSRPRCGSPLESLYCGPSQEHRRWSPGVRPAASRYQAATPGKIATKLQYIRFGNRISLPTGHQGRGAPPGACLKPESARGQTSVTAICRHWLPRTRQPHSNPGPSDRHNVLERTKALLAPPEFANDDAKTHQARVLNTLLATVLVFLVFLAGIAIPFLFTERLYGSIGTVAAILLTVAAWSLMRGGRVRLAIKNLDPTLHTLTLPEAGVDVSVSPGSEKIVEFNAPASGVYQWYCIPHASMDGSMRSGMVGSLIVQ